MSFAVELNGVYKLFTAQTPDESKRHSLALEDISFSIEEGSLTVVGGSNGSGKSVLMNIIAGLIKPTKGSVKTSGKPGLIFQDAATQILGDTVEEDIAIGPENLGLKKAQVTGTVDESLKKVSLEEKRKFPAEFLSGGEKRRLAVASILAMDRKIIIFDEPYANLDYPGVLDVNNLVKELHSNGKTIILLTHELEKCLGLADRFIVLNKGKLVFSGTPQDAMEQNLEQWGIRNPLTSYGSVKDLVW